MLNSVTFKLAARCNFRVGKPLPDSSRVMLCLVLVGLMRPHQTSYSPTLLRAYELQLAPPLLRAASAGNFSYTIARRRATANAAAAFKFHRGTLALPRSCRTVAPRCVVGSELLPS